MHRTRCHEVMYDDEPAISTNCFNRTVKNGTDGRVLIFQDTEVIILCHSHLHDVMTCY